MNSESTVEGATVRRVNGRIAAPSVGSNWNEAGDLEYANWKRIRLAIEHENALTNARFTWLLTSQGLLLAAFALIFTTVAKGELKGGLGGLTSEDLLLECQIILLALSIAGMVTAFYFALGLRAAHVQHDHLRSWWMARFDDPSRHPRICGNEPRLIVLLHYHNFPFLLFLLWAVLGVIPFIPRFPVYQLYLTEALAKYGAFIAMGSGLLIVGLLIGVFIGRSKVEAS